MAADNPSRLDRELKDPSSESCRAAPLMLPAWQPDSPTLTFKEMLKITKVGRSTAYVLIKTDPTFPKGTPVYDSERSPKFYWTHEVLAWSRSRTAKFHGLGGL
ncbi:MAG: hypothetical protein JNJ62_07505 [Pseudoxanthomonas mexicana]|nr:hypothetical protein [Pseudoxanthomonas mexicana]